MPLIVGGVGKEVKQEASGQDLNKWWRATRDSGMWFERLQKELCCGQ